MQCVFYQGISEHNILSVLQLPTYIHIPLIPNSIAASSYPLASVLPIRPRTAPDIPIPLFLGICAYVVCDLLPESNLRLLAGYAHALCHLTTDFSWFARGRHGRQGLFGVWRRWRANFLQGKECMTAAFGA